MAIRTAGRLALILLLALLAPLGVASCGEAAGEKAARAESEPGAGGRLVVERGYFERRVVMTGELEAAEAASLIVPRMPSWQAEVRWLAEDGALVEAGERVLELDSSSFTGELEDKEISLAEKLAELESRRVQAQLDQREARFQVTEQEAVVEKARLDASVPEDLVSRREIEELRLELEKAEMELARAEAALATRRETDRDDIAVQQIEIRKSRREIDDARRALDELTLTAPRGGILLIGEHPHHDRKIQVGDQVWVDMEVASLPDLSSMVVEASLPDVDDGEIAVGMPAEVVLDAHPERVFRGTVQEIGSIAQEESQASLRRFFQVTVDLDEVDGETMIPGMSARVEVLAERRPDVLLVPRAALVEADESDGGGGGDGGDGGGGSRTARAFLAGGGTQEVGIGPCDELRCVVTDGLEAGTALAPAPLPTLADAASAARARPTGEGS